MGKIFVLSGASSVGKTTFLKAVSNQYSSDDLRIIPRHTERPRRPGEEDGFEYQFLSHRDFLQKVYAHDFIHVERWGNFYTGIDRNFIEDAIEAKQSAIVLASTFGAARLRATYTSAIAHLYMWTGSRSSLMDPRCMDVSSAELQELIWRIRKKNSEKGFSEAETESMIADIFVERRMVDNFVDIAAVNGRLRKHEDIYVLSNYRDQMMGVVDSFRHIWTQTAANSYSVSERANGCFVLMPFRPELNPIYEDHIVPVCGAAGISASRADKIFSTKAIIEDIKESVSTAKIVIADLTDNNPNVFYEVGICHTLRKAVVLITQNLDVPFDLRHLRCIFYKYTPPGMRDFEFKLKRTLETLMIQ